MDKTDEEIKAGIMQCQTFGELLQVLGKYYDTNFAIPFILKFGMANQLPKLLKPFKRAK